MNCPYNVLLINYRVYFVLFMENLVNQANKNLQMRH